MEKSSPSNTRDYLADRKSKLTEIKEIRFKLLSEAVSKAEPLMTEETFLPDVDPLTIYLECINAGACPPASVLVLLADCFEHIETYPIKNSEQLFRRIFYPKEPGHRDAVRNRLKKRVDTDTLILKIESLMKSKQISENEAIEELMQNNAIYAEPESIRQRLYRRRIARFSRK